MEELPLYVQIITSALLVIGAVFALIGALGLVKLPDFYMRLHGPTKATTLGLGAMLVGSMVFFTAVKGYPSLHEVLVTIFLFLTAPVSAHLLAKAALRTRLPDSGGMVEENTRDLY